MRITGLLAVTCLAFVLGCDPVYFSKYRIVSSRTAGPLCPQIQDPNELLEYAESTITLFAMFDEEDAYCEHRRLFMANDGTVILEFGAWNRIDKTKKYEKQLINRLKQESCIEITAFAVNKYGGFEE